MTPDPASAGESVIVRWRGRISEPETQFRLRILRDLGSVSTSFKGIWTNNASQNVSPNMFFETYFGRNVIQLHTENL